MAKSWTPLEEVRLFWDKKTNTVKVTSSDPRLGGESFVLQLSRNTRADELAREVLTEAGIKLGTEQSSEEEGSLYEAARLQAKDLLQRPTLPLRQTDPNEIIIGYDVLTNDPISWAIPDGAENLPTTLGIFGLVGQGKTVLIEQILAQASHFDEEFDIYLYSGRGTPRPSLPQSITAVQDLDTLLEKRSHKRRLIVVDGAHEVKEGVERLLRCARSFNDVIIFTEQEVSQFALSLCRSTILIGKSNLRQRITLGVDRFGVAAVGEGVFTPDPTQPKSSVTFHTYLPQSLMDENPFEYDSEVMLRSQPRQLSADPFVIPLGTQGNDPEDRIDWDLRYYNLQNSHPYVLGVFGRPGVGKTVLAEHVLSHVLRFPYTFDVYVCNPWKNVDKTSLLGGKQVEPHELLNLPKPIKRKRVIIIDSVDIYTPLNIQSEVMTEAERKMAESTEFMKTMLKQAKDNGDIIIFTAQQGSQWMDYTSHYVVLGFTPRKVSTFFGVTNYPLLSPGDAALVHYHEDEDPEERSSASFRTFAP